MLLLGYSEEVLDVGGDEEPSISDHPIDTPAESAMASENVSDLQDAPDAASNNGVEDELASEASDSGATASVSTPVNAQAQAHPSAMRRVVVILAGFCILAFLGGIGVLMFGRRRG